MATDYSAAAVQARATQRLVEAQHATSRATEQRAQAEAATAKATGRLADAHTRQADALERIAAALEVLLPAALPTDQPPVTP